MDTPLRSTLIALSLVACGMPHGSDIVITEPIDFGLTPCGATASPKTFSITSSSGTKDKFTVTLAKGDASPFIVSPSSGTLAGSLGITLTPKPIPKAVTDLPGDFGDTLTIASGGASRVLSVSQGAQGAIIENVTTAIDFGDRPVGSASVAQNEWSLMNRGNAGADLVLASSNAEFAPTEMIGFLGPGSQFTTSVQFAPSQAGSQSATLQTYYDAPGTHLCAPLPPGITVTGNGI